MNYYSNIYKPTAKNLNKSVKLLKGGQLIGIPTETVYGLGSVAYNNKAVKKIYKLKKRPTRNPIIVHFKDLKSIQSETMGNKYLKKLYKKFSPGPITYVLKLKKNSKISKLLLNKNKHIACRVPRNKIFLKILKKLNKPIAAPSANISNKVSPTSAFHVHDEFKNKINLIIDGGSSNVGIESTVIDLTKKPELLREGFITQKKINTVLQIRVKKSNTKNTSPGQSLLHYSPGIPVYLNRKIPKKNGALLVFGKSRIKSKDLFYLSKKRSLTEASKKLYKLLRKIKKNGYKNISVTPIPNKDIGVAINDRLKRSAK